MAKQYQNPCTSSNFQKATLSLWFRIPTSAAATAATQNSNPSGLDVPDNWMGGIELFTFGNPNPDFSNTYYTTFYVNKGDLVVTRPPFTLPSGTYSMPGDVNAWHIGVFLSADPLHDSPDPSFFTENYVSDYDLQGQALIIDAGHKQYGHVAYLSSPFQYDVWHHLMVAIDASTGDSYSGDIADNGNNHTAVTNISRGRLIEIYFDKHRIHGRYKSSGEMSARSSDGGTLMPSTPVDIVINDSQVAIPTFTGFSYNPEIKFAEFQCWLGKYIDPVTNMSKFVDATGKPVAASVPEAAFGKPTFRFRRDKKKKLQFTTNDGTGGTFSSTSGIADFKSGPSL